MNNIPVLAPQKEEQSLILSTESLCITLIQELFTDPDHRGLTEALIPVLFHQHQARLKRVSLDSLLSGKAAYNDVMFFQQLMSQSLKPIIADMVSAYIHQLIESTVRWPVNDLHQDFSDVALAWIRSWKITNDESIQFGYQTAVTDFVIGHLDETIGTSLNMMFAREPWRMWSCRRFGGDFLIERNVDYRVFDWELKHQGTPDPELYDLVSDTDYDQINALNNEIIAEDAKKQRDANRKMAKQMLRFITP